MIGNSRDTFLAFVVGFFLIEEGVLKRFEVGGASRFDFCLLVVEGVKSPFTSLTGVLAGVCKLGDRIEA